MAPKPAKPVAPPGKQSKPSVPAIVLPQPPPTIGSPDSIDRAPGLGGMDLGALAARGAQESSTRIGGQKSILDAYLNQVLGEAQAGNAAQSERQSRMFDFRRSQQLLEEQVGQRRLGQESALQRARIAAAAKDSQAARDFAAAQSAQERAFELGQAAVQRDEQEEAEAEDRRRWEAEFGLQQSALEAERGLDPTTMSPTQARNSGMGYGYVGQDRGQYLNARPVAGDIRSRTFEHDASSGVRVPGTEFRIGGSKKTENRSYQDILAEAREFARSNTDPMALRDKLLDLFNGSHTAASLAMFELADLAQFEQPEA